MWKEIAAVFLGLFIVVTGFILIHAVIGGYQILQLNPLFSLIIGLFVLFFGIFLISISSFFY